MSERNDRCGRTRPANPRLNVPLMITSVMILMLARGALGDEPMDEKTVASDDAVLRGSAADDDMPFPEAGSNPAVGARDAVGRRMSRTDTLASRRSKVSGFRAMRSDDEASPWYRTAIGSLAIVLALVAGAYFLVRKFLPAAHASESGLLRVVGRAPLSPKQSVALLHLGRRFVVVGVSPDRLDALCEISDTDEVAELTVRASLAPRRGRKDDFDEMLAREAGQLQEATDTLEDDPVPSGSRCVNPREPLTDLLNRLRKMRSR